MKVGGFFSKRNVISNFPSVLKVSDTRQTVQCLNYGIILFTLSCFCFTVQSLEMTLLGRLTVFTQVLDIYMSRLCGLFIYLFIYLSIYLSS